MPEPDLIAKVRDVLAREQSYADALHQIAGRGDVLAGIHLIEECAFECEWWCLDHQRCAEAELCDTGPEDDAIDCIYQQHIHCAPGCPTRIALAALA